MSFTGEFTEVVEFFRAPPAEASLRELDIALAGVVGIAGNALGRSITPMPPIPPGARKTSSE